MGLYGLGNILVRYEKLAGDSWKVRETVADCSKALQSLAKEYSHCDVLLKEECTELRRRMTKAFAEITALSKRNGEQEVDKGDGGREERTVAEQEV